MEEPGADETEEGGSIFVLSSELLMMLSDMGSSQGPFKRGVIREALAWRVLEWYQII